VLFDPFGDFGKVLVLLADVVFFAEVDKEDDGFGGEEEEGVDYFDLSVQLADALARLNGCSRCSGRV